MKTLRQVAAYNCGGCGLNRRKFLTGCVACATGAGLGTLPGQASAAEDAARAKVRLVFAHTGSEGPIWPNIGYDFEPGKRKWVQNLSQLCPGVEFLPVTLQNADEAKKLLAEDKDKNIDGYLVLFTSCWTGVPAAIAASGKPTIYADELYQGSGEWLIQNAAARRTGMKVAGLSTSRVEDVADAARCFELLKKPGTTIDSFLAAVNASRKKNTKPQQNLRCPADVVKLVEPAEVLKRLKESTILLVGRTANDGDKAIESAFGTKVVEMDFKELNYLYQTADRTKAKEVADAWMGTAEKVIEPSRATIVDSAAMYLAKKALLKKYNAQAITINCLGGFYGGHITAYPCLGFNQLNNDGLVGACESDTVSTITMLTMTYLTGRPGMISDPILDTSKNQIIYAHCVAPSKVFGPEGPTNPYHIRTHSEDRKGAAIRSLMPLGYMTTTLEIHPVRKELVFHQAKAVENVDDDRACRTKLAGEVKGDIEKLMNEWDRWGWHRVTYYGDLRAPIRKLAAALQLKVIEEA